MTIAPTMLPTDPIWCLDRQRDTGTLFWRRDSSRVKFRDEVEVLEFVRDPEEIKFMMGCKYSADSSSHPIVAITTVILTIAITVVLPWVYLGTNGVQ